MSRIGKKPVPVPQGVQVAVQGRRVTITGPKGSLTQELRGSVQAEFDAQSKEIRVRRESDLRADRALHGLFRALLANMVEGVTKGYEKRLQIQGLGFRANLNGRRLQLFVGYNTKVPEVFELPEGVSVTLPSPTEIVVAGPDKQLVGQVAAQIRHIRTPDVYKGKGVRYLGEAVRKLPGKAVGVTATK